MKKSAKILLLLIAGWLTLAISLALGEAVRGGSLYYPVIEEIWKKGLGEQARLCLAIPRAMHVERGRHLLGHRYFLPDKDSASSGMESRSWALSRRQMEALTEARLFERTATTRRFKGEWISGYDYQLTDAGWTESKKEGCLDYGPRELLEVIAVKGFRPGLPYHVATIREGLQASALRPWAKSPAVHAAFPEIQKMMEGQERTLFLSGKTFLAGLALSLSRPGISFWNKWFPSQPAERKFQTSMDTMSVGEFLKDLDYLALPFAHDTDNMLEESTYNAVVFPNPPAKLKHPALKRKVWPYLEHLVKIGVLNRSFETNLPLFPNHQHPARADGYVYRLTPVYSIRIGRKDRPNLVPLGKPSMRLIDVTARPGGTPMVSQVFFRLRVTFEHPPHWIDADMRAQWPDLDNALRGYACTGMVYYNRISRQFQTGGAYTSCAWAYRAEIY
jgi:hypothetical protein